MGKDETIGIIVILGIIAIASFGGMKTAKNIGPYNSTTTTSTTQSINVKTQAQIEQEIKNTQKQVNDLKAQLQAEEDKKTQSKYFGKVKIQYVNRATKPGYEYITLHVDDNFKENIPVTGWTIKSLSSGSTVSIPFGTQLFFANTINSEDSIVLTPGDTVYIVTGISPNGYSFRVNKCSGYLSQFQTFVPYLSTNCPRPANEDLSSIPNRVINDACFDYINTFPSCRIQTQSLPKNWSYECTKFIYDKINYPSCVTTHKNDSDFYKKEWRVYLKRSDILWKNSRENIVLYDNEGKIVSSIKY